MRISTRLAPGSLKVGLFLLVLLAIPGAVATTFGGQAASMAVGLAAGCALAAGSVLDARRTAALVLLLGVVAGAGAAVSGDPLPAAAVVGLATLLVGLANSWSVGSFALAPILAVVFAAVDRGLPWQAAALWSVFGGVVGVLVLKILKVKESPQPLPPRLAWRHAVVLALAAAATLWFTLDRALPHGYWIPVTLLVALRPLPAERRGILADRLWGTLVGAAIALVAAIALPPPITQIVAVGCLVLVAGYGVSRHYFLQTVFLTPMLLLFATAGDDEQAVTFTTERVLFTVAGVLLGAVLIALLAWWDAADAATAPPAAASGPDEGGDEQVEDHHDDEDDDAADHARG